MENGFNGFQQNLNKLSGEINTLATQNKLMIERTKVLEGNVQGLTSKLNYALDKIDNLITKNNRMAVFGMVTTGLSLVAGYLIGKNQNKTSSEQSQWSNSKSTGSTLQSNTAINTTKINQSPILQDSVMVDTTAVSSGLIPTELDYITIDVVIIHPNQVLNTLDTLDKEDGNENGTISAEYLNNKFGTTEFKKDYDIKNYQQMLKPL